MEHVVPGPMGRELTIRAKRALEGTKPGDSVSLNGVCLTVTRRDETTFSFGCTPETLRRTNLGQLVPGDKVNLERALTPGSPMGGHFVQGHVDATGIIVARRNEEESLWLEIGLDAGLMKYVVPKGFVAVDGISLTVVDVFEDRFTVMLVAWTQQHVTLSAKPPGSLVNIEVDMLGKYVERIVLESSGRGLHPTATTGGWTASAATARARVDLSSHADLFDTMDSAIQAFRAGRPVVVVDDESRENEGDLIVAAEHATPELINFMAREARGLVCVAMTGEDIDRLGLPMMVDGLDKGSRFGSPFTVSVDARTGVSTGISAHDRARTVQVLIDPTARPDDLSSPGHVFPLRAHPAGVLARRGHTEAGVDLARMAGLRPAAVICEIMSDDGSMARRPELIGFARTHGFPVVAIDDIAQSRLDAAAPGDVTALDTARLPTRFGEFRVTAYRDGKGLEHLMLRLSEISDGVPVVRIHSECLTGDVLGSVRCDCGDQLDAAMEAIAVSGNGALIYLRQEGRGIGLANKVRAYALQDAGLDTVEANTCLGFRPDLRDYAIAAAILKDQGLSSVRLLTNNPQKVADLTANGIEVIERIPLVAVERPENVRYLRTKAEKLVHLFSPDTN